MAEMKVFLVVLCSSFEFRPVKDIKINKYNSILTRPYVTGEWAAGAQLPVIVRELK